jgi:hypothetical protein
MGGSAFLIYGELDAGRAAAAVPAPSFFNRLRGRQAPSVSETRFPNGRSLLEFPADAIGQPLARDYHAFVRDRVTNPSPASLIVFEYLKLGQPTIYLRADRGPSEATGAWYVQVSFSSAAGMAETSARVAAHWASRWYEARAEEIRTVILQPAGFAATSAAPLADGAFVPTRDHGYAEREDGTFTFDACFLESDPDPETLLKRLEHEYGLALRDGRCRCDMC